MLLLDSRFENLKELRSFDADYCNIVNIMSDLSQNLSLTTVNLSCNKLRSLANQFAGLSNIEHLVLYDNRLSELPASIGNLPMLQVLDVGCNYLISIPDEISRCQSLQTLNLSGNHLYSLPDSLISMKLDSLSLGDNFLTPYLEKNREKFRANHLHSDGNKD